MTNICHPGKQTVLNSLDGYQTWQFKYRHWQFAVLEDDRHGISISTQDLRNFYLKAAAADQQDGLHLRPGLLPGSAPDDGHSAADLEQASAIFAISG